MRENASRYVWWSRPSPSTRILTIQSIPAHGADVLHVTSPNLPNLPVLEIDTTRGKRTTQLDLNVPRDHKKLEELTKEADVFLQA